MDTGIISMLQNKIFLQPMYIQAILMDIVTDTACNIVKIHWMNINLEKYFLFKKFKIF